jgi:hypothetical protein
MNYEVLFCKVCDKKVGFGVKCFYDELLENILCNDCQKGRLKKVNCNLDIMPSRNQFSLVTDETQRHDFMAMMQYFGRRFVQL